MTDSFSKQGFPAALGGLMFHSTFAVLPPSFMVARTRSLPLFGVAKREVGDRRKPRSVPIELLWE